MYPSILMMTSLVADKSVTVKFKIILNFLNEIINPPCNSLLATFFELCFELCLKKASSCSRRLVRPKWTVSQLFKLLFPLPLLLSAKRNLLEGEARRVLWQVQRDQMKYVVSSRQRRALRQMWRTKMRKLMLLMALTRLGSLGTSLRGSRSQKCFVETDLQRRMCPRVSLTPLAFHNVSFQIFNIYL